MKNLLLLMLFVLLGIPLLSGCVKRAPLPPWVSKISGMKEPIGSEEIFLLPEGDRIPFAGLLNDLDTARVIFIGESHDQIEHHQIQVRMLQGLLEKGKDVVIAMEMFERSQQPILDQWSQGFLTEEELFKEVKWESTWAMDYQLYKGILDEIRSHRLKLLGLNVQRDLIRKVARNGIDGLSSADRKMLPEMDLTDQQHRAYIHSIYKSHQGGSAKDFEYFYQAQCLWDEAMAETLSEFLKFSEEKGKIVLVFAGNGHVVFDFGIPKRLYRRVPISFKTIVLKEWKKEIDEDLIFTGTSLPLTHFLWITRPNPPEKKRPRIGVILKAKENLKGLWIEQVIPKSPAEKAGLLPGDQFISIEGKEITRLKDIHDAVSQKGWGRNINMIILRKGVREEITVKPPPAEE